MVRIVQIVVLVLLVSISAWWLVSDLDWTTVRHTLTSARPGYLLGVLALLALNHVARSLRLKPLVAAPVAAWDLVRISAVGFLAIQVLPLRLGELVRPQLLVRHGVSFGEGLGAIAVDRILDVLMLLVFLGLVAFVVPLPSGAIEVGGIDVVVAGQRASAVLVAVATAGLVAVVVAGPHVQALVARMPFVGERVAKLVDGVVRSLRRLGREPRTTLVAAGWTVVSWTSTIALVWLAQHAFDGVPTLLSSTLVLWTAAVCAMAVLPTPGFFGPFEAATVAALAVFGANPVDAKAFALVLHLLLFGFAVLAAVASLATMPLSMADLRPGEPVRSTPR